MQSAGRGLGEGSRSRTLLHRWRFGAGQHNHNGRASAKGSTHTDVELQESALHGDLCREQLDGASPYEHLASEQSWYAEQAEHVGGAGAGGANVKCNIEESRARQAHDVQGGCKATLAGTMCAVVEPGRLDRGRSLHATCEVGAEHAPSYARGHTAAADAEALAQDESLIRTMYKAPSFFTLLRDDSEPLDVAVVDGYLSVASSVGASDEASVHGSVTDVPARAPGPVGSAGDASIPAAGRHEKQGNGGSGLFSAWRRRPECRNEASRRAGIVDQGVERDGDPGLSGRAVGKSQQPAHGEGGAGSFDLTARPWDSGISLNRGYFDHGGLAAHVRSHAVSTGPGTIRRLVGAKLVHGDATTSSTWSSASRSDESDASDASIEILREREVNCGNGSLLPHSSLHDRSYRMHPQIEQGPVNAGRCREGEDEGAGKGEDEGAGQAKPRRGNNDGRHSKRACARRLLPRVVFSPEPVPPEMDPRRPPIEVGSWSPSGRGDVEPSDADEAMACCDGAPRLGGKRASIVAPVVSGEKEGESSRENWRPNVPAAGSGRHHVRMAPAKDTASAAANGALAPNPEALTACGGKAARAGLLFSSSASSQRLLTAQSSFHDSDASPTSALLHAKFFESCIVIEEYLSLFALEI